MDVFLIRLVSLHPYQTILTTSMRIQKRALGLRESRLSRKIRHGSPHGLKQFLDALFVGNSIGLFSILRSLHQQSTLRLELDSKPLLMNELQSTNSTSQRFQSMCFGQLQVRRSCHSKLPCRLELLTTATIGKSGGYMLCKKASSRHTQTERVQSTSHLISWTCVGNFHYRLSLLKEYLSLQFGRLTTCNTFIWMILGLITAQAHHTSSSTCQDQNSLLEHCLPQ